MHTFFYPRSHFRLSKTGRIKLKTHSAIIDFYRKITCLAPRKLSLSESSLINSLHLWPAHCSSIPENYLIAGAHNSMRLLSPAQWTMGSGVAPFTRERVLFWEISGWKIFIPWFCFEVSVPAERRGSKI